MFASYLQNWPIWRDLIPLPIFSAAISFILLFITSSQTEKKGVTFAIIFSLSLLGVTAGQLTGQSREPAVAAVVPAALSLMGGITVYLVASKSTQQQLLVAAAIIAFSLNLLIGTFCGTRLRYDFEDYRNSQDYLITQELIKQNVKLQQLINEKQLMDSRKALGLPLQ